MLCQCVYVRTAWASYSLLEHRDLLICQSVGLCDDWDQVDLGVKSAHDLDVKRLQRVTGRLDEVHASMDAIVDDVHAIELVLGLEIRIESLLNVLDDWAPGVIVVDEVAKARCVYHRQA